MNRELRRRMRKPASAAATGLGLLVSQLALSGSLPAGAVATSSSPTPTPADAPTAPPMPTVLAPGNIQIKGAIIPGTYTPDQAKALVQQNPSLVPMTYLGSTPVVTSSTPSAFRGKAKVKDAVSFQKSTAKLAAVIGGCGNEAGYSVFNYGTSDETILYTSELQCVGDYVEFGQALGGLYKDESGSWTLVSQTGWVTDDEPPVYTVVADEDYTCGTACNGYTYLINSQTFAESPPGDTFAPGSGDCQATGGGIYQVCNGNTAHFKIE